MMHVGGYVFKLADSADEIDQIHRLNYRTFVREIPQHSENSTGRLIDKYHRKSTYFIAKRAGVVVGMVSMHSEPPFSVASRLPDPGILDRPGVKPIEIRLLAVDPEARHGPVTYGLLAAFYEHVQHQDYTDVFISAVTNRIPMYRGIGFEALGPPMPAGGALFVPMVVSLSKLNEQVLTRWQRWLRHSQRLNHSDCPHSPPGSERVCLLPGPVIIAAHVREAFHRPPIYHRGAEFISHYAEVRGRLCQLVGGRDVALSTAAARWPTTPLLPCSLLKDTRATLVAYCW